LQTTQNQTFGLVEPKQTLDSMFEPHVAFRSNAVIRAFSRNRTLKPRLANPL